MRFVLLRVLVLLLGAFAWSRPGSAETWSDDFEDGTIDSAKWTIGGSARGWQTTDPLGTGPWSHSHSEGGSGDGYLRARVWGPGTGATFGSEAWVSTTQDFNDGNSHLINIKWEGCPAIEGHYDLFFIQITDGYIPEYGDVHWPQRRPPLPPITEADLAGTADLLIRSSNLPGWSLPTGYGPTIMSIQVLPTGTAQLYDDADGSGSLVREVVLNQLKPWHVRCMVSDATSSGFGPGDTSFNLYDFSVSSTVTASVSIKPETLNLKSKGTLTAFVDLPDDYDEADISIGTVECEGAPAIKSALADGRLVVHFNREDLIGLTPGDQIELTVVGQLVNGIYFEGMDAIQVVRPGKEK